ncbi:MAG: hypothetical protein B6242_03740 [Anaerolineaceae bacterium 4572_78]|nr:MAG: hypothetical protein B6242_03740 [Anaerolineaceae bacterium 4572_78]
MEGWFFGNMRRVRPDGTESDNIIFFSPPADTKLVNPTVIEGRWLIPEDDNAVVVNTMFLNNEDDVKLGDTITLKIQGEEEEWHVVGIMVGGNIMSTIFTNYKYISQKLHRVNESEWIFTQTTDHSPEFRKAVQARIEEHFGNLGVRTSMGVTVDEDIQSAKNIFALLVALMLVMATLIAVVGGLGLMGTMSINVLERTREVGVMRAIGAGNRAVLKIVMIEGVLIGVLSWFIAMLVALPVSKLVSDMIGQLFMSAALDYTFSYLGATIWLVMVIVLAMVSSLLPAWSAVRLTVREVLSYE